jgi:hypothetical protein
VPRSAPKVRSFRKNLLRKKMAPPRTAGPRSVGWKLPRGGSERLVLGKNRKVRRLRKFPVQNDLPHDRINATNFVLALVVSLPPLELHRSRP